MHSQEPATFVFLSKDMYRRYDFLEKARFKFYDDCIFKSEQDTPPDQMIEVESCKKQISDFKKKFSELISTNGHGLYPIFESELDNAEYYLNDADDISVKFSLLSVNCVTSLFPQVLRKRIPFALISPNGPKCEWLFISSEGEEYKVDCAEKSKCNEVQCPFHDQFFRDVEVKKAVKNYGLNFKTSIKNRRLNKIPVFELSTGIDIIRWWQFYQDYQASQNEEKRKYIVEEGSLETFFKGFATVVNEMVQNKQVNSR